METMAAAFSSTADASNSSTAVTAASIISGTSQALGSLVRYQGAKSTASQMDIQAGFSDVRAQRETLAGQQQANAIRQELLQSLASQQAAAGASGLAQSSDVIATGLRASRRRGAEAIGTTQQNAHMRARARRFNAFRLRQGAKSVRRTAKFTRDVGLLSAFSQVAKRGLVPEAGGQSGLAYGTGSSPAKATSP